MISENNICYDTICLSGGGLSGFCFIGALKYLDDNKYINLISINTYVGTSVGAIIAFLLAIKYSICEIYNFLLIFNFNVLEPDNIINNLFEKNGFDDGNKYIFIFKNF